MALDLCKAYVARNAPGRGDVAVITKFYITRYLLENPQDGDKLLVLVLMDQTYAHTALVKKGNKPKAQEIDAMLEYMVPAGIRKKLRANYGIRPDAHRFFGMRGNTKSRNAGAPRPLNLNYFMDNKKEGPKPFFGFLLAKPT